LVEGREMVFGEGGYGEERLLGREVRWEKDIMKGINAMCNICYIFLY